LDHGKSLIGYYRGPGCNESDELLVGVFSSEIGTAHDRFTDADRARSLAPAGVREGPNGLFHVVYRFKNV
jgi:hypothetical protein